MLNNSEPLRFACHVARERRGETQHPLCRGGKKCKKISSVKISFFEKNILIFFSKKGRKHLPWRKKDITPYEVWVSEIMLQQTQVDRVIDFYVKFLKRFPTVRKLAKASWEEFLPYYQGLGYYNRGRNMLKTAQAVLEKYAGKFPLEIEVLETLPGIGKYTARAVASFAGNLDHLAWDVNFARVFGRFFVGSKNTLLNVDDFEGKIVADKRDFNGAIMDFGSLICVKKPKCSQCLLQRHCVYFKEEGLGEQEAKKDSEKFPTKDARVVVFLHKNHRIYYSKGKTEYTPFSLSKKWNTREGIKTYFQEKFDLTISVRPPHKKVFVDGQPIMYVNAQVLLGEVKFGEFTKKEIFEK